MFITNNPDIAKYASKCLVGRIFIDLEIMGKYERQGHLDTVISQHSLEDIENVRTAIPDGEILVRINPLHSGTQHEIDIAIKNGADIIMLPMFSSKEDIDTVGRMIGGRAQFIPLIETKLAAENLIEYVNTTYVNEFYIGLNDLHRELDCKFMFELLSSGYVEGLANTIKDAGKKFGFGGIARIGDGVLPSRLILAEHARLGSSSVILSRAFHQRSQTLDELKSKVNLNIEVKKLFDTLLELRSRNNAEIEKDRKRLLQTVDSIVEGVK